MLASYTKVSSGLRADAPESLVNYPHNYTNLMSFLIKINSKLSSANPSPQWFTISPMTDAKYHPLTLNENFIM